MRDRKPKKKVVLELPDIELPGCPGRGVLVLGLLKNLMPGLKISQENRDAWIQTFKEMGSAEISWIISLSHDENRCRRAIEKAVKTSKRR